MNYHIRDTCRLCASPDLERLLTLPDTPLANELMPFAEGEKVVKDSVAGIIGFFKQDRFPLHLVGCNACGHVQLPVVVDPKRLFGPGYPYQSGTSPVFREHLVKLATTLAGMLEPGARVLDVACNDGTLVKELAEQGMHGRGIDPAAPRHRNELVQGFFTAEWAEAVAEKSGRRACITALNVFAHVDDLDDFMRGVKVLLEPCGLFVIEVGYLPDVIKRGAFDTIYHEHVSYHHLSPLVRFFKRHGMTLVDAHRIDSQGGSVRMYVRNCDKEHVGGDDGHNEVSARLQALLDDESRSAIWQGVRGLADRAKSMNGWIHWLYKYKASPATHFNEPLAIYGAPAKLTTLLHATGSTEKVGYVVDDNPLKQGRYVPGTRIPILPVAELYKRKPKVVLLASWNFADEVKQRHAELGCEWYVPFEVSA
jgi:SAM-dependent methyltransferase